MCRHGLATALAMLAAVAPPAATQSNTRRLRAVADSLAAEWRVAVAAAARSDSLTRARAAVARDTMRAGALVLLVPRAAPTGRLRAAAARAWGLFDSTYGDIAGGLDRRPLVVDVATTLRPADVASDVAVAADASTDEITRLLAERVPRIYGFGADRALGEWVRGVLSPAPDGRIAPPGLYLQVVTAPSRMAQACFAGSLPACRAALTLDPAGDPVVAWYDAAERLAIARGYRFYLNQHPHHDLVTACTSQVRDAACIHLLRTLPPDMLPLPVPAAGRIALARLALRMGGRGAYARLLARPNDPISNRLAAAAGVTVDSLVVRWRAEVIASRPRPVTIPAGRTFVALAWASVFVLCGLRSSRWRVS